MQISLIVAANITATSNPNVPSISGPAASLMLTNTSGNWVEGGQWSWLSGSGSAMQIAGVTPATWVYAQPASVATIYAVFAASGQLNFLMTLQGFGGQNQSPSINSMGTGVYNGPDGTLGDAGDPTSAGYGQICWFVSNVQT